MSKPITRAQLNSLEQAADKVFGRLGIDIEFTRHFLDRVNDARNKQQITIRELASLFAKEYKRWGNTIAKMPIDAQAVMKDLGTELNIPFVLNKDGQGKDLVAKTVMRKKNFTTSDRELEVESITEEPMVDDKASVMGLISQLRRDGWSIYVSKTQHRTRDDYLLEFEKDGNEFEIIGTYGSWEVYPDGPTLSGRGDEFASLEAAIDYGGELNSVVDEAKMPGVETGSQVKGNEKTPKMSKPTTSGETPHPYRGRLVGEEYELQIQKIMWEAYQTNERIIPRQEAVMQAAYEFIANYVDDHGEKNPKAGAFEASKMFNLGKTARELLDMWYKWKDTGGVAV